MPLLHGEHQRQSRDNNCRCPIWVDGTLQRERINRGLGIRDWTRANEIIRDWEIARTVTKDEKAGVPVRDACGTFISDLEARRLSTASMKKYRVLLINERMPETRDKFSPSLSEFCAAHGVQFTNQITLPVLMRFRSEWKDGALSGAKKLERLRCFGRFLEDQGWWPKNLAQKLKRPTVTDPPTMPFTR